MRDLHKKRVIKFGKGKIPPPKLDMLWNCLRDRQPHSRDELLKATGYQRADSTGFKAIMKALRELGLIESVGRSNWAFVESKVFPMKE